MRIPSRWNALGTGVMVLFTLFSQSVWAAQGQPSAQPQPAISPTEAQLKAESKRLWLLDKLKSAKPAPVVKGKQYSTLQSDSVDQTTVVGKSLVGPLGKPSSGAPTGNTPSPSGGTGAAQFPGKPGLMRTPFNALELNSKPKHQKKQSFDNFQNPLENVDNQLEATPPSLLLNTTVTPFNSIHKLLMEFVSATDGQTYYYVCSGWATGSFHIATAGHCVYNHDPNGDGDQSDATWANQIWAWAAQTDQVEPFDVADHPFGVSTAVYMRSYTGWTTSINYDHDWALVTLDRRQGDHTGWMGREEGVATTALNFSGYPTEQPYVPANTLGQYFGFDNNNVLAYTAGRIQLDALIYGGHSGGPSWRYDDPDRWVQGIHSTSDRMGYAEDTLLTSQKLNDLNAWMADDAVNLAPTDQVNLIEYWFDLNAKELITTTAMPGDTIEVEFNVLNAGFVAASDVTIDFYISENDFISTSDTLLGSLVYASLSDFSFINATTSLTVPSEQAEGVYYVGWILSTTSNEYETDDNTVVITSQLLTVGPNECVLDTYEPNNSSAEAQAVSLNGSQTHSICPQGDEDWVTFTLAEESEVIFETTGFFDDTRMWLYDQNLTLIEFDDDSGSEFYSRIDRQCFEDALAAGTYFVRVNEYTDETEIFSYNLETSSVPCSFYNPDIAISPQVLNFDEMQVSASQANLAQSVSTSSSIIKDDEVIHFKRGSVKLAETVNQNAAGVAASGRNHFIVSFKTMPTASQKKALQDLGIDLMSYLPSFSYWAKLNATANIDRAVNELGLKRIWLPDALYKVSPRVDERAFPPHGIHGDGTFSFKVNLFSKSLYGEFKHNIRNLGGGVRVVRPMGRSAFEVIAPIMLAQSIANLDSVRWVEPVPPPHVAENVIAAQRVQADVLQNAPHNLNGSGVTVGVWDGGAVDTHPDFDTRLLVVDALAPENHATHVAGTIAASGAGNSAAQGMANATLVHSYDWNSDEIEMRAAAVGGQIDLSNHSYGLIVGWFWDGSQWVDYGSTGFGLYDSNAQEWDDIVYDTDLLVFKSAGNDRNDGPGCPSGPDCDGDYESIGYQGNAKNVVSVCATTDSDAMSSFSSWGPTDDGRVKPDLCANGTTLTSTLVGNTYGSSSGTSMSSPSAAGTAALLYQYFENTQATTPSAQLLKTLLIHGADDLGQPGPDYQFGWGIINAETTRALIETGNFYEGMISGTGEQFEISFSFDGGDLGVTLGWTDVPGDPAAAKALVNDLNLVLVAPDNTEYLPFVLNPATPSVSATVGVNSVDNIEQVSVPNAAVGTWKIRVTGFAVPSGPQSFAIVGSGLGDASVKSFTVANEGALLLDVTQISSAQPAPWLNISPTSFSLAAGASQQVLVSVDFAQAPAGFSSVQFDVLSNDPDESPYPGGLTVNVNTAVVDTDNDGLTDDMELLLGTNIHLVDTDGDGISDYDEVNQDGDPTNYTPGIDLNPLDEDTDGDGYPDGFDKNPLVFNSMPDENIPFLPIWAYGLMVGVIAFMQRFKAKSRA